LGLGYDRLHQNGEEKKLEDGSDGGKKLGRA
jgi:hypothetical protein